MHNNSQPKRLVLFDIDGTLLHSGGCGRAALRLALQEVFGTIGALDDVNLAGKTDWQILLEALTPAGIDFDNIQQQLARFEPIASECLNTIVGDFAVAACAGAPDVIATLRTDPHVVMGLVTGNLAGLVPIKLRTAGYDPSDFKIGAFGADGWERAMLPPKALQRARALAGIDFAPHEIVIVGDTPSDIACAHSIQARTIAVATGGFSVDELQQHGPTYVFENMSNYQGVLDAIWQTA